MLDRVCLGTVARKHHVALRDEANHGKLLYEHCLTRRGFDGAYTIFYERALPPRDVAHRRSDLPPDPEPYFDEGLHRRHFMAGRCEGTGDHLSTRQVLLCNADVAIGICRPLSRLPRYFSNADGDELYFVQSGSGTIESVFGPLSYHPGDYILIPRGAVYRVCPAPAENATDEEAPPLWLFIEGRRHLEIPPNFRNPWGQLRMDAPYSHRDFRRPSRLPDLSGPDFTPGRYPIVTKRLGIYHEILRDTDPMDIVGWDGSVYPIALSIHDYQPKVGRVHLPPTMFSTFTGGGFIVCSFVPRLVDFDKDAVPCPYPHSSVDCDEVIFYSSGNFTSRRGIGPGSISHHPTGIPHGPQPGAYEASLGKTRTDELAVMIDTFLPLGVTTTARSVEDPDYHDSWRR
jgi:homogentisate 1,2-dioxygenase